VSRVFLRQVKQVCLHLSPVLATVGLDGEGSDIVRVHLKALLAVVASLNASVELDALDPGQAFKHLLSLRNFQSFEEVFSSFQKLAVIVEGVSQADVDLLPVRKALRKPVVGLRDLGGINLFSVQIDHEANAQKVEGISVGLLMGELLIEPLQRAVGAVPFPVLVHPNSLKRI
jgi:hypothetical protein